MNLFKKMNYELNEGVKDVIQNAWKAVKKKISQLTIKKAAYAFFKKYPELLKYVKSQFGATNEEVILENKFKKA